MKKTLIIIGVVIAGLILIGYLNQPEPTTQTIDYSSTYKDNFMEGCLGGGANKDYCYCTYDRLEALYGIQGIIDASARINRGELNSDEKRIIKDCAVLL